MLKVCISLCFMAVQVSKISLVDLAGSERADSSGAKGMRLKVRQAMLNLFVCFFVS